jgi:hypothetical protein
VTVAVSTSNQTMMSTTYLLGRRYRWELPFRMYTPPLGPRSTFSLRGAFFFFRVVDFAEGALVDLFRCDDVDAGGFFVLNAPLRRERKLVIDVGDDGFCLRPDR